MIDQDAAPPPASAEPDTATAEIVALFAEDARNASLLEWAGAQGLDLATVLLAGALARTSPEGQASFVAAFVAARARDKEPALRWLLWLWDAAEVPIRARFSDESDRRAAEAVMEMHRRVLAGEAIGSADWRQARRRFAGAVTPQASQAAVEAIMSSMWDIGSAPGAIADVAHSWITQTAAIDALAPAEWTATEHARVTETWDAYGIEQARHNRQGPDETDDAFRARMQAYMRDHPLALSAEDFTHWKAWQDHQRRLMQLRSAELRRGLLAIVAA